MTLTYLITIFSLLCLGLYLIYNSKHRNALQVLADLKDTNSNDTIKLLDLNYDHIQLGFFNSSDFNYFLIIKKLIPVFGALLFVLILPLVIKVNLTNIAILAAMGAAIGYFYSKHLIKKRKLKFLDELQYYIPIVMERLVMAVQAGRDVISGLQSIINQTEPDVVTRLLQHVVELVKSGLTLDKALNEVALKIDSSPLRHAFIHLALAYKDGGELSNPLKELSDATQNFYQDSMEEQIAKLPGKAVLPLMLTFTGLMICFITVPMMQVMDLTKKNSLPVEVKK